MKLLEAKGPETENQFAECRVREIILAWAWRHNVVTPQRHWMMCKVKEVS